MSESLKHIGFIADGNRRWAKEHGLPTLAGHKKGAEVIEMLCEELAATGLKYVSFFVFSTENWNRSSDEVSFLMDLITKQIGRLAATAQKNNLRLVIAGRSERVDPKVWQNLIDSANSTKDNTGMTVCFCFNYGGKWEIADAATRAIQSGETTITPEILAKYLYCPDVPDIDFVVRTSGEQRLSGFQLWRSAYSELYFMDKYFPELTKTDIPEILAEYQQRQRRFGK